MASYHESGTICEATKRACPLRAGEQHIEANSQEEFEAKLAERFEDKPFQKISLGEKAGKRAAEQAEEMKLKAIKLAQQAEKINPEVFEEHIGYYRQLKALSEEAPGAYYSIANVLREDEALHYSTKKHLVDLAKDEPIPESDKKVAIKKAQSNISELDKEHKRLMARFSETGNAQNIAGLGKLKKRLDDNTLALDALKRANTRKELMAYGTENTSVGPETLHMLITLER